MEANKELINEFDTSSQNTFIVDNHKNKYMVNVDKNLTRRFFSIFFQYSGREHGILYE
jgi:hypothetical protein